ncbi:MAG: uncharacterized protein QOJ38_58 [Solirubrobacterales bacterium]|nr:uncharacterized protein [Solirubrobacterales bacterium]
MIRAVIDPNVLVSAFISPGGSPPDRIVRAWAAGAFELVASPLLISELVGVLARPKFEPQAGSGRAGAYVAALTGGAVLVEDVPNPPRVCTDADDDYLFALARAAKASFIVSGDRHLLDLETPDPSVLTPREFVEHLG